MIRKYLNSIYKSASDMNVTNIVALIKSHFGRTAISLRFGSNAWVIGPRVPPTLRNAFRFSAFTETRLAHGALMSAHGKDRYGSHSSVYHFLFDLFYK